MLAKASERLEARKLRAQGTPYRQIAALLNVSINSAYRWSKDIELTAEQIRANRRGPTGPQKPEVVNRRSIGWSEHCRRRRRASQLNGRAAAREGDDLHLAGCMLYWAEGAKGRTAIEFVNSDSRMLRLFRRFLTDSLGIDRSQILVSINVYTGNGLTIDEIEGRWLDLLDLPRSSVRKHIVNHMPTSSSGQARNKLPYGVCTLRIHDTSMLHHIFGAIQEYGGFEEPAWLR